MHIIFKYSHVLHGNFSYTNYQRAEEPWLQGERRVILARQGQQGACLCKLGRWEVLSGILF